MKQKEEDGRMFPTSNSSATVVDCLLNEARRIGGKLHYKFLTQKQHSVLPCWRRCTSITKCEIDAIFFIFCVIVKLEICYKNLVSVNLIWTSLWCFSDWIINVYSLSFAVVLRTGVSVSDISCRSEGGFLVKIAKSKDGPNILGAHFVLLSTGSSRQVCSMIWLVEYALLSNRHNFGFLINFLRTSRGRLFLKRPDYICA